MTTYAIGDIQGCYDELIALLNQINFAPEQDRLWLVGDLVNRGPKSLETLRYLKSLGDRVTCVWGNHDLHLLAIAFGNDSKAHKGETLNAILNTPDHDELIEWLRQHKLAHYDAELGYGMVHAGLSPEWTFDEALSYAAEVEAIIYGDGAVDFFADMYGSKPNRWDATLSGMDRHRYITNCFTRLRYCKADGSFSMKEKLAPEQINDKKIIPWFQHPQRQSTDTRIIFGHWSTLGYRHQNNVWAIDSGCLWGGKLTAIALEKDQPKPIHLDCRANCSIS